jgi:ABC-type phosphate transport system substrate-binding protein/sugar phosphate isomerase/epimerase
MNLCTFELLGMEAVTFENKTSNINQLDKSYTKVESKDTLKVAVATTTKALMKLIEPAFETTKRNIKIASTVGSTGDMVELVMSGKSKVAITTRNLKDYEKVKCPTLVGTPIGLDGLAIVVSNSNPISNLTFEQISAIWTGKIVNWKELGGPDLPIVLIGRTKAYDSIMLFCDFMKLESKEVEGGLIYRQKDKENWCPTIVSAPETDDLALTVLLKTPGAISYFPLQILNNYIAKNIAVKTVSFDGVQPTKETIANGTYFIHRTLNAITNGQPEGITKTFVDFLLSNEGQIEVTKTGFLTQNNAAKQLGWQLTAQAWTFNKFTFAEALDKMKAAGINTIEMFPNQKIGGGIEGNTSFLMDATTRKKVLELIKSKNMKLVNYGVVNAKTKEEWTKIFEFAKDMGIETIVTEADASQLDFIEPMCEEYQIKIALHNHPKPSIYWDPEFAMKQVVNRNKYIGVCADLGHWLRSGLNPLESLKKYEGRIFDIHAKDLIPSKEGFNGYHDVPWGTGISNFSGMMHELKRQGYRGTITVEYEFHFENSLEEVTESVEYFNRVATFLNKE